MISVASSIASWVFVVVVILAFAGIATMTFTWAIMGWREGKRGGDE